MNKRNYYFSCAECGGTVVRRTSTRPLTGAAASAAGGATGALGGGLLGFLFFGIGAIPGAIIGGSAGAAGGMSKLVKYHPGKFIDCGATYDERNIELLQRKAVPKNFEKTLAQRAIMDRRAERTFDRCGAIVKTIRSEYTGRNLSNL